MLLNIFNYIQFQSSKNFFVFFWITQAPVPIDPWTDTIDAFEHISGCMRTNNPPFKDRLQNDDDQSEDCLALNIYVPGSIMTHFIYSFNTLNPPQKQKKKKNQNSIINLVTVACICHIGQSAHNS